MNWIKTAWVVWVLTILLLVYIFAFWSPDDADAKPVTWNYAGASVYGGACPGAGTLGYRGDALPGLPHTFAELSMGRALGLPYKARVRFLYRGRKVTGVKRDIGGGGGHVNGRPRVFDFWEPLLTKLLGRRNCNWTGVVAYRRVK